MSDDEALTLTELERLCEAYKTMAPAFLDATQTEYCEMQYEHYRAVIKERVSTTDHE